MYRIVSVHRNVPEYRTVSVHRTVHEYRTVSVHRTVSEYRTVSVHRTVPEYRTVTVHRTVSEYRTVSVHRTVPDYIVKLPVQINFSETMRAKTIRFQCNGKLVHFWRWSVVFVLLINGQFFEGNLIHQK